MRFAHDCSDCKPLGEFGGTDLYFCDQGGIPTVIARYGENGDYFSGLGLVEKIPELAEAKKRAVEAGYLIENRRNQMSEMKHWTVNGDEISLHDENFPDDANEISSLIKIDDDKIEFRDGSDGWFAVTKSKEEAIEALEEAIAWIKASS